MRPYALLFLLLSACYNPKINDGTQLCAAGGQCPSGLVCGSDHHCYHPGNLPSITDLSAFSDFAATPDLSQCTPSSCQGATPICNLDSGQCVACLNDPQCAAGQLCKGNVCVAGCSSLHGCADGGGACDVDAAMCRVCRSDSDCADPNSPRCDVGAGQCVPCLPTNDNCGGDQVCVQSSGVWHCTIGCKVDNDCTAGPDGGVGDGGSPDGGGAPHKLQSCCNHVCVDVTGDAMNCGRCGGACMNGNACCASVCTDLTQTLTNCGQCGNACGGKGANWQCAASACAITTCQGTFRDCNMDPKDGCEANIIADPNNCLACGKVCVVPNARASCNSRCGIGACNPGFADCNNNLVDGCEANIGSDPANCGACKKVCAMVANGSAACAMGACSTSCNMGFADCDKNPLNGCEVNLNGDVLNCKVCGDRCAPPPNALPACGMGVCGLGACNQGFKDCDGNSANGCEVNLSTDPLNCSACGNKCAPLANAQPGCFSGMCGLGACTMGFADCDKNPVNGCEANVSQDNNNCGACGKVCSAMVANGSSACSGGACVTSCNQGYADCDKNVANGCEANLSGDANNCGACGSVCSNMAPYCVGGRCTSAALSCNAIKQGNPNAASGIYPLAPNGQVIQSFCDMTTSGGGFTLILNRLTQSDNSGQPDLNAVHGAFDNARGTNWNFDVTTFYGAAKEFVYAVKIDGNCPGCTIAQYDSAIDVPKSVASPNYTTACTTNEAVTVTKLVGLSAGMSGVAYRCPSGLGWGDCNGSVCHYGVIYQNTPSDGS